MKTMTTRLSRFATACVLLAAIQAAYAWTAEDCKKYSQFTQIESALKDCMHISRVAEQQNLPDGSQPTEAQRLERVKEILRKQTVRRLSYPIDDEKEKVQCTQRLKAFETSQAFQPIEPVAVLDSPWIWDDKGDPRVPAVWNQCKNTDPKGSQRRLEHMFNVVDLRYAVPPSRLYHPTAQQRPNDKWRYVIDTEHRIGGRVFEAISFKTCEIVDAVVPIAQRGLREVPPPQQAYALTHYQGEIVATSIVDGVSFDLNTTTVRNTCSWALFPQE